MEFPKIDIDVHDFKKEVKLELCTPAKKGIAELTEAYGVHLSIKAMMLAELSFNLPTKVDRYGELIDNPNIVNMRPYYLVRLSIGKDFKQYFRIAKPKAEATGDEDFNSYACRSYEVILSDRQLLSYSVVSYTIDEILNGNVSEGMNGILADTNWTVGYVSTEFTSMRRSVDSGNTNKLDFILNNLSKAYNCIPIFDTVNNEINIYSNTEIGEDLGLTFSYRKYIEAFGLEYDTDEFTSRLRAVGKDGISLHEVTPTGQPYLENFAYFMQGFEQDDDGNVIGHSPYWSDELCKKQLEYEELLDEKQGVFEGYLLSKKALKVTYGEKETELFDIATDLYKITDRLYALQDIDNSYHFNELTYDGTAVNETFTLNSEYKYMVMANVSKTTNLTLKLDGTTIPMTANVWKFLGKIKDKGSITVGLSGSATNVDVTIIVVKIMDEEYSGSGNEAYLIERYCEPKKEREYDDKFVEMVSILDQIDSIDSDIEQLRDELSIDLNFGVLAEERNGFIIEKTFENNNITDAEDLLKEARDKFLEVNSPALVLDLNSVNFLDIISDEAYYDKDKIFRTALNSGVYDWVTVNYEPFNVSLKCMILEIDLDVENSNLRFTFSNVREILSDDERRMRDLYKASTSAMSFLRERFKYDEAFTQANLIRDLLDSEWDAATRSLRGGTNLSVEFGKFGIKITDPDNPLRVIQLNDSYIGISVDGGNTFKSVISAEGIAARRLIGEIVLAAQLHIVNAGGNISFTEDGMQVFDQLGKLRLHIGNIDVSENRYGLRLLDSTGTQSILDDRGMLQSWSDSMADNVDSTHKLKLKFYIPDETISIRKIKLNFSREAFRAYATGAASGGGHTTASGGGSTSGGGGSQTSSAGGSHSHSISARTTTSTGSHRHVMFAYSSQTSPSVAGRHYHALNSDGGTISTSISTNSSSSLHTYSASGDHSHSIGATTSGAESSHTHTVSNHTHSTPNHVHTVSDHVHPITYGIYESTIASSVRVYVNSVERLGPYSTDQDNLDLTQWITTAGWQTVELSSSQLGRINASLFVQIFLGI